MTRPTTHDRELSQSSVIISTSRSTSPSASPVSPGTGTLDGISRRHSWNRPREQTLGENINSSHGYFLNQVMSNEPATLGPEIQDPGPSRQNLSSTRLHSPEGEYDLGTRGTRARVSFENDPHHRQTTLDLQRQPSASNHPSYYLDHNGNGGQENGKNRPRPYFHRFDSEVSIGGSGASSNGLDTPEDDEAGTERLTFAPPLPGSGHRREPSRSYDEYGNPKVTGVGARVASAVGRSSTIRNVSKSIRAASVRVVNVMGSESDGRVKLQDEDDYIDEYEMEKVDSGKEDLEGEVETERPALKPPEGRLRGKTLGIFGPESKIRRAMDSLLRYPYTEPVILILIIVNAVALCVQAASPLNTPRVDAGYFKSWEDFLLFGLFIIFTLEMFARVVVTGLLLDPGVSLRHVLFDQEGIFPTLTRRLHNTQDTLRRTLSRTQTRKVSWRSPQHTVPPPKKFKLHLEAPFQKALAKQQSLSEQGRPYLRHSWHRVDMLAVFAFWITFLLAITGQEATADRHLYIFRGLSILRAGRLLVITSGTTTILHSLKRAGPMLITVGFFLVFAFSVFSIIGVQSFNGSFRRQCAMTDPQNSTNVINLSQQCGGYMSTSLTAQSYRMLDGTPALSKPKGYICPVNQVCITGTVNPDGNATSFDNIFIALVQVIIITVVNGWAPIMYSSMDTDFFASCLYFIVAAIILNFWFLNLLTAVVVNTFKDIRAQTKRSAFGATEAAVGGDQKLNTMRAKIRKATGHIMDVYHKTQLFWVALVLADLVAQATRTAHSSDDFFQTLSNIELAFTLAFDVEIGIRIAGHFPDWRLFLSNGRNVFDLFLAISCSIIQIPVIATSSVYAWLTVFQLLRWYRFILAFPRMKPLLMTVFGSFAGLLNMIIFLFLINLLAALAAVQLFRGDIPEGETITLSQTYNAFLGMYQVFSSENWTDLLDLAMQSESPFQQSWLAAVFFCVWILFAYAVVLQMFIAVINENFAVAEEQKRKRQIEDFIRRSEPVHAHVSWIDRFNPYRLVSARRGAVKVETLPPNLVLPIKQNVGVEVGTGELENPHRDHMQAAKESLNRLFNREERPEKLALRVMRQGFRPKSVRIEDPEDDDHDERGLTDLLPPLNAGPSADEHKDALREKRNQQADFINAHPSYDESLWLFKQSNPVRRLCQKSVEPAYGDRIYGQRANPTIVFAVKCIIFLVIVAGIVVAGIATPEYRKGYYDTHGVHRSTWFDLAEVALGMVFIIEAAVKIIADGFIFAPNAYLLSLWNIMDFLILVTLLINTTTSLIYIGGLSRVTRALKACRALRLITLFSRLRETLHAVLFAGAIKLLDASVLMILYLIPFAVWGLNIFSGLLFSCNDGNSTGVSDCINEYIASPLDDSLQYLVPRVWANPTLNASKWAFDSFREAILILFEIVSLEGWIDVMQSAMAIAGRDLQSKTNAAQWNAIYFLLFNLLGAVVILTLFLSVIIGNFSARSGDALLTRDQRRWVDLKKFIRAQTPSQLPKTKPESGIRAWCYDRATHKHGYWARSFTVLYFVHILLLMTEDFSSNILTDIQLDWIFLFLTILYSIDLHIRFMGLGLKSFQANGWNLFDFVVILGSFATTIPALKSAVQNQPGSQVVDQFQKLFLVAISFKLVQRIDSLNQLFKTSVASLPAIRNLFMLWATLFIFFAMLMLEVFGLTKMGNNAGTRFQNYYTFGNALVMLAFMSTGEGWNGYMHDYTISSPRCTDSDNYLQSDCGSSAWAYGLFISWNIISMYIFTNMFTGVVVESFAYVYQMPGHASLKREEMRSFKRLWAEFDTERTGYIKREDFVKFFSRLSGIFEVRIYPPAYSIANLMRGSIPDPVAKASGRLLVAGGVKQAVDVRRIEAQLRQIDYTEVGQRRQLFARLYHEARVSEERGKGLSFTAMLTMLAHYKLIDDEKALLLGDLLVRREKTERVTDLVNLDRVRGLLRTIYWRRRFLATREERRRTLNAEQNGIPAIVLEPTPLTPPSPRGPFDRQSYTDVMRDNLSSPSESRNSSPSPVGSPYSSPDRKGRPSTAESQMTYGTRPSLSTSTHGRPSLNRQVSSSSMLSSEDAHWRRGDSPMDENPDEFRETMENSVWSEMMREAVDEEER